MSVWSRYQPKMGTSRRVIYKRPVYISFIHIKRHSFLHMTPRPAGKWPQDSETLQDISIWPPSLISICVRQVATETSIEVTDPVADTAGTPNGIKVSILLEELGLSYEVRFIRVWPIYLLLCR